MLTNWISKFRKTHSRIQACTWLFLSIVCAMCSMSFTWIQWTPLKAIPTVLGVVLVSHIPRCAPQNRFNLHQILPDDLHSILKTASWLFFFNIFAYIADRMMIGDDFCVCGAGICLYMFGLAVDVEYGLDEDMGFSDGILYAIYGVLLKELRMKEDEKKIYSELPTWLIHVAFAALLLFKNIKFPVVNHHAAVEPPGDQINIVVEPRIPNNPSMAKELADKAKEAFLDEDFDVAVDLYSKAIDLDPNCAAFFADRAQANIKIDNFTEAVADANRAIELEPTLAKAYLRKGTACMKLEEYSTAKAALEKGSSVAPNDSKFKKMLDECNLRIEEDEKDLAHQIPATLPSSSTTPLATAADAPPVPTPAAPAKPMFRHEFYQKPEEVVVAIFAKGIPKENVTVEFGDQILSVVINVAGEEAYHFQPRLFGKIVPDKCRYEVLSTKVEIRLAKSEIITWASLEYGKGQAVLHKPNVASAVSQRPVYPSSKPGKDWDKLEAEVKKQEKDEKLDGDAAMNKFFSDIYQTGDEDMRRAMNKSFAESNGTVLSTNWKEVGTKKVESTPPDGMELKKWEY